MFNCTADAVPLQFVIELSPAGEEAGGSDCDSDGF